MAYRYFGLNFGQHEFDIQESDNPLSTDVELRIDKALLPVPGTNADSLQKLSEIMNYLAGKSTRIN